MAGLATGAGYGAESGLSHGGQECPDGDTGLSSFSFGTPFVRERADACALAPVRGRWGWDFGAMEAALAPDTRLLLLCHPHNPVGRAWGQDELSDLAGFCQRHDLIVCSDEIHCDLILDEGRQHTPLAMIDAEIARRCITLMAPSKTYNIPGLGCAFAVIADAALRRRFTGVMRGIVPDVNVLGLTAAEAAYRDCEQWRAALINVLRRNRERVETAVSAIPGYPWHMSKRPIWRGSMRAVLG